MKQHLFSSAAYVLLFAGWSVSLRSFYLHNNTTHGGYTGPNVFCMRVSICTFVGESHFYVKFFTKMKTQKLANKNIQTMPE